MNRWAHCTKDALGRQQHAPIPLSGRGDNRVRWLPAAHTAAWIKHAADAPAPWRRGALRAASQRGGTSGSQGSPEDSSTEPPPPLTPPDPHAGEGQETSSSPARGGGVPSSRSPLSRLREHLNATVQRFLAALDSAWLRAAALLGFVVAIISAVVNLGIVPIVNTTMLPGWQDVACRAMQRQVRIGRLHGVSLAGLTGLVPLVRLGPTSLGPGPVERSSLVAPQGASLYLDPVTSLVQQQVVLALVLDCPTVTIVQGDGFSWVGYPDDTTPSSRNPVPGLVHEDKDPSDSASSAGSDAEGPGTPPPVALGRLLVRDARLALVVQAERVPRYLEHVTGTLTLGSEYRSLELRISGEAHMRHVSSLKCTVVTPTAKRHLRHVTPGSGTPKPHLFGCDVLPPHLRPDLQLQHMASSAGYQATEEDNEQQPSEGTEGDESQSQPSHLDTTHETLSDQGVHPARSSTNSVQGSAVEQPVTSKVATLGFPVEDKVESKVEVLLPAVPPVSVHHMVRVKRGRQAEAAAAAGLPLSYELKSYGSLLTAEDAAVGDRAQAVHLQALESGDPHEWPDAPWAPGPHMAPGSNKAALAPTSPSGGRIEVTLSATNVNTPGMWPDMLVVIRAADLHAPLVERLLELPMDVHAGRLTGELRLRTYDHRSWQFPELYGRVQCQDVALHFWDASDDILDCSMELVFERDRVYLHSARGWFGAVPLAVAGDLDLNPETGSYRLSASVLPGVEINALRATLGVRPTPQPVAGAVRGVMHCTGPLEHPVFSGTAVAVRLPAEQLLRSEPTLARDALLMTPHAVAGYDKVPILGATIVFTMDTTTQRFNLHSAQVVPIGGGQVSGQGVMWVAPEAESHPNAINMACEASNLNTGALLGSYLPPDVRDQLPPGALSSLGLAQLRGAMFGSHLAPEVTVQMSLPQDSRLLVGASAAFSPSAISMSAHGPAVSLDTTVHISTPHQAALRAADTQAEASHWARPRFEGVDLSASVSELDLLSMARHAAAPALDPVSTGQPLRARCSGGVRASLRPVGGAVAAGQQQQGQLQQQAAGGGAGRPRAPAVAGLLDTHPSLMFAGQVQLSSMRINNLELIKQVSGQLGVSGVGKLLCSARSNPQAPPLMGSAGIMTRQQTDQELLEVEVAAPEMLPALNLDPDWSARAAAAASLQERDEVADSRCSLRRGPLLVEASSANGGREYRLVLGGLQLDDVEAGSLRGNLTTASLEANIEARQGRASVCLDSLRYASLAAERLSTSVRWEGDVVKLEETVITQQGSRYEMDGEVFLPDLLANAPAAGAPSRASEEERTRAAAATPADAPAASRAEVASKGRRAAAPAAAGGAGGKGAGGSPGGAEAGNEASQDEDGAGSAGRWRLAVHVPAACLQDLLPATQLLSATQHPGRDYGSAKASFLHSLGTAGQRAVTTHANALPLAAIAGASGGTVTDAVVASGGSGGAGQAAPPASATGNSVLPALQELSGSWSGRIQVFGDVQGASNVEFNLQGHDWKWGLWRLDRIAAVGTADSEEGVVLEELSCASGPARASLKGALLGGRQDAQLAVTNFPLAMLQPLYAALPPALQGVPPPANQGTAGALRPFASLSRRLETSMARLSTRLLGEPGQLLASSPLTPDQGAMEGGPPLAGAGTGGGPVSGLVFMSGWLGGSTGAPEATLDVKVDQGAVGATRLKQAVAAVTVDSDQRVVASVQLRPQDMEGSVSLHASLSGNTTHASSSGHHAAGSATGHPTSGASSGHHAAGSTSGNGLPGQDAHNAKAGKHHPSTSDAGKSEKPSRSSTRDKSVEVKLAVRDGGMAVLCALTPALQWQSGTAVLDVDVHGSLAAPHTRGSVHMANATLSSPVLKHPVTGLKADVQFTGTHMVVNTLEAKVGRLGRIHAAGTLPLLPVPLSSSSASGPGARGGGGGGGEGEVSVELEGLELRVANVYSGALDAALQIEGAALAPSVGGSITFSRGTLNLQPPSAPTGGNAAGGSQPRPPTANGESGSTTPAPSAVLAAQDAALVRSAFALLRAGRKRATLNAVTGATEAQHNLMGAGAAVHNPAGQPTCQLVGLQLVLGPELRATFPVVLNVAVSGQVSLSGPADPLLIAPSGALVLESGTLNLVATQFVLDREHTNRLLFFPEAGLLDPVLDIIMVSGDLRAVVAGRGSAWQEALSLSAAGTSLSSGGQAATSGGGAGGGAGAGGSGMSGRKPGERAAGGGGGSQQLELSEVARVFEERLAEALLGENGQLALRSLASSTLHTLLPKLETRGQLGAARWRLVGAPALPNLLGVLDAAAGASPSLASTTDNLDPAKLLSRLAVGTELELMWGSSLTAALQHKLLNDSKIGTEARLTYRVTDHLRLNLQLQGLTRPSLTLGYTSDMM